jgi:inhibitor of KinA sporulation pathway (predicted exonuclease)
MNYIVIDLEWNQSPLGKGTEIKEMPFEIIEIGAVKLNENRERIDCFSRLIKPQVYHELHSITKEIIHIEMQELESAALFAQVIKEFFDWCGNDYVFCTWGAMDLTELQKNIMYYKVGGYIEKPIIYYDVQKLYSLNYEGKKNPRTLEYAIDCLQINKEESFHRALVDAKYTAEILKRLDIELVKTYYSLDYFHNPKTKAEEISLNYGTYYKYISSEYNSKEELLANRIVSSSVCYKCDERAGKKIRWFTANSKTYYCLAFCKNHGYMKGKIRIKKH